MSLSAGLVMERSRGSRWMGVVVVAAVVLRLCVGIAHPFWFPDSADYDALAQAIAHGRAYQVHGLWATRMPGYPIFMAAVYFLVGPSVKGVLVAQALMGGLATWWTLFDRAARFGMGSEWLRRCWRRWIRYRLGLVRRFCRRRCLRW